MVWVAFVAVVLFSSSAFAAHEEAPIEVDFGEAKPVRLELEAAICHSDLRMRVNKAMHKEYESKTGDESWIEMLETFQQEAKEAAKELAADQESYQANFGGRKFDTRVCGDDASAHLAFEKMSTTPPEDPKLLEEYSAVVPEPNFMLAVCVLKAAAAQQEEMRGIAASLAAQKPGAKTPPKRVPAKKAKGKGKGKAEPTPTAVPTPLPPGSAKRQQLEDAYTKRFGKKPDYTRCQG